MRRNNADKSAIYKSLAYPCRRASHLSSSDKRSHYDILGVSIQASHGEIKAKYYELSKKFHPDRNRSRPTEDRRAAAKKYTRIKEAYEVLGHKEKRTAFDSELSERNGGSPVWSTHRNARSNEHYYGHTKYSGTQHQASSLHRRPSSRAQAYYSYKHQAYANTTKRSAQSHSATNGDPLHPRAQTGSNYDVPHFDFDKHYHQQRSYDNHRKMQTMKMAQRRFAQQHGGEADSPSSRSSFQTDQEFIHHHYNPYSKPTKPVFAITGPGLIVIGSGTIGLFYFIAKYLF